MLAQSSSEPEGRAGHRQRKWTNGMRLIEVKASLRQAWRDVVSLPGSCGAQRCTRDALEVEVGDIFVVP